MIIIIKSFLIDRTFVNKIEDSFSSNRHILADIPQGTLYLGYINDISTTSKAHLSLFADDMMSITFEEYDSNMLLTQ